MTNYARGARAEYLARDYLYALGYVYVMRSAGSHGALDLIAIDPNGHTFGVQVKRRKEAIKSAVEKITAARLPDSLRVEIWEYVPRNGFRRFDRAGRALR